MKNLILAIIAAMPCLMTAQTLTVDSRDVVGRIPYLIYGAGAEDVNHEIYGGLYDQRIFGEGFEEPAVTDVVGFTSYDSRWSMSGDILQIVTSAFGKIIYDSYMSEGVIEVDMRMDSANPIAGFVFNVSNASNGADAFDGYEVSLNASEGRLVYGKHVHDWKQIASVPVDFDTKGWNRLRIDFVGAEAKVYVNAKKVYEYKDTNGALTSGRIGLRSYGGSASFRSLRVDGNSIAFTPKPFEISGFRQYDNAWNISDGMLQLVTDGFGKIVYHGKMLGKGSVEVEMRLDGPCPIAGLIYDVQEAGEGADRFRGYEVSLDADDKTFVFGKHDHNWQPVFSKPVSFVANEWNRLRVDFDGIYATVYLNDSEVYKYSDSSSTPLMSGNIGLRSYDGSVSFRHLKIDGVATDFVYSPTGVSRMWEPVGDGTFIHDASTALTGTYSQSISGKAGVGIANMGLNKWGIGLDGSSMHGCIYLKGDCGKAFIALQNADGSVEYARQTIDGITSEWQRFAIEMTPNSADSLARFVVCLADEGTLWVDQAMLYTDSYPFRKDLKEAFAEQHLTFLRYGGTMVNAPQYMTKNMIGNRELRAPYIGHWYYNSTNGFAIPEFVEFARLIGAEPTFAINIEDNPSDVLAMFREIEKYGINYIEIGNEENLNSTLRADYEHYVERFHVLYDAIHAVYPDLKFINAAWWRADQPETMEYVFRELDGKSDFWDYHPWTETFAQAKAAEKELQTMQTMFKRWNPNTAMRCAILEENGNTHDMARALTHAEMLNIARRMNGFVAMDSPANALQPYRQNDNGWDQGQIFFSTYSCWCQPSYYVQQTAALTHQPLLVKSSIASPAIDVTVTRNETGDTLVIHVVNPTPIARTIRPVISNFGKISSIKSYSVSASSLADRNTLQQPEKIKAVADEDISPDIATLSVKGYSYTAFVIVASEAMSMYLPSAMSQAQVLETVYDILGRRVDSTNPFAAPNSVYIKNGRKELHPSF